MKINFGNLKILAVCVIALATGRDFFGGTQMTRYEKQSHHSAMRNYIIDLAKYKDTPDTFKLFISDHEKRNPSAVAEAKEFLRTGNSASRIRTTSGFRMDADDSSKEVATIMTDARAALGITDPAFVETSTFAKAPADGLADRPAVALAQEGSSQLPKKDVACGTADDQGQASVEEPPLDATIPGPIPRLSAQPPTPAQIQRREEHDPDDPSTVWREVFGKNK